MAVLVRIPAPLRPLTQGEATVEAQGGTVEEVLKDLGRRYPAVLERIFDGDSIRQYLNVFLNDEDIRFLEAEKTPVKDGDVLSIIPAIAGGTGGCSNSARTR
jgi:molybdopterin synthase sulfur carrier subunit